MLVKGKGKVAALAVLNQSHYSATGNHMPRGISVLPRNGDFPIFTHPKLVLDLATSERFTAELT